MRILLIKIVDDTFYELRKPTNANNGTNYGSTHKNNYNTKLDKILTILSDQIKNQK